MGRGKSENSGWSVFADTESLNWFANCRPDQAQRRSGSISVDSPFYHLPTAGTASLPLLGPAYICFSGLSWFTPVSFINAFGSDTSPANVVLPKVDESVKRRPWPISNSLNEVMFPGIPMNVIGTAFEVIFITHDVLPEPGLPNSAFSSSALRLRDRGFGQTSREPLIAELGFDLFHAQRVAFVIARQLHHQMPVIGEQYVRHERKRMALANGLNCPAQKRPPGICGKNRTPRVSDHGKEKRPTRHKPTSIIRHPGTTSRPDQAQRRSGRDSYRLTVPIFSLLPEHRRCSSAKEHRLSFPAPELVLRMLHGGDENGQVSIQLNEPIFVFFRSPQEWQVT